MFLIPVASHITLRYFIFLSKHLQNQIFHEFIVKYNKINMNPGYDPIDNAGNLLTQNYNKTLLSGMIFDIKQQMMSENTKNILINLTVS